VDDKEYESGKQTQEDGGSWRDNPHRPGTTDYYAFEDGRRDAGAKDVGPADGTPSWS
jgi:hypothetical protein